MSDEKDDAVGYKRPPEHSRWKKGQSGYPSGRKKGKKPPSLETAIGNALMERVVVTEKNGKSRSITKLEAAATQLANKAASGHMPSIKLLASLAKAFPGVQDSSKIEPASETAEAVRARIAARLNVYAARLKAQRETSEAVATTSGAKPNENNGD